MRPGRWWWGMWLLLPVLAGAAEADFRADLQKRSLLYFLEQAHPVSGLIRDRAASRADCAAELCRLEYRMASLAATGFGLAVLANAAKRGLLDRAEALQRLERVLRFTRDHLAHHHGWLYHFVDWASGERWGKSEISTVDTAWFLAGALYAGQIFPGTAVESLASELFERVDFLPMMTDGGALPSKRTLSMGWFPESGYLPYQWDSYAEHMLLVLLGLGHPRPLPTEAWLAWKRPKLQSPDGGLVFGPELPLFAHQYSHLFVDFRGKTDGHGDYWKSSVSATKRDHDLCAGDPRYFSYRAGFWGLSASGSISGYQAFSPLYHDGTVCPGCAGASWPFAPELVGPALEKWATGIYGSRVYGRYGFIDSLNLDQNWFDPDVIGITVGAMYLAAASMDEGGALWPDFEKIPAIRAGLLRAGVVPSWSWQGGP